MTKNTDSKSKILTPDKAFGGEALDCLATAAVGVAVVGTVGAAITGYAAGNTAAGLGTPTVFAGGVMHTVAATHGNVPLHTAAHTVMKVGGIGIGAGLGAVTVGAAVLSAMGVEVNRRLDEKSDTKKEETLPFSKRRELKYSNKEQVAETVTKSAHKGLDKLEKSNESKLSLKM